MTSTAGSLSTIDRMLLGKDRKPAEEKLPKRKTTNYTYDDDIAPATKKRRTLETVVDSSSPEGMNASPLPKRLPKLQMISTRGKAKSSSAATKPQTIQTVSGWDPSHVREGRLKRDSDSDGVVLYD